MDFILVTPERANIKMKRISTMVAIGTVLVGFRKRPQVNWMLPSANKALTILEVINHQLLNSGTLISGYNGVKAPVTHI
jgi:transcription elongation GreA/GreB family factor